MKIFEKIKENREKTRQVIEIANKIIEQDNNISKLTSELHGIIDAYYVALELNKNFRTNYKDSGIDFAFEQIFEKIDIIDKSITKRNIVYYDNLEKIKFYNDKIVEWYEKKLEPIENKGFVRFANYILKYYVKK